METTKRQKIWNVLLILAILGVAFIIMISFQVSPKNNKLSKENLEIIYSASENTHQDDLLKEIKEKEDKENRKAFLIALGTGLLIAGASFSSGSLSGFLFGIPRIINSLAPKSAEMTQNVILHNDNLVQISDWLTKIIVGVGLTQINALPNKLYELGKMISPCFNTSSLDEKGLDINLQITIAISIIIYFLILGFITSYLWTRIYFGNILKVEAYSSVNQSQN